VAPKSVLLAGLIASFSLLFLSPKEGPKNKEVALETSTIASNLDKEIKMGMVYTGTKRGGVPCEINEGKENYASFNTLGYIEQGLS